MSIRYSFGGFTTKGHGVIEYADPSYYEDGKKPKRRRKVNSKFATRWPSAAPLKVRSSSTNPKTNKTLHQRAQAMFKQRFPAQQPKKGQIKAIMKELQKSVSNTPKPVRQKNKNKSIISLGNMPDAQTNIDEITLKVFNKRFPGQKPQPQQLNELKQEVISERKKLGL